MARRNVSHWRRCLALYASILSVIGANATVFPENAPEKESGTDEKIAENTAEETKEIVLPEISKEELREKLVELGEELETFEFEGVDKVLNELFGYQYQGQKLEELLLSVKEKADAFDFMGAEEELTAVKEKTR